MKNLFKNLSIIVIVIGILLIGKSIFIYHFFNTNIVVVPKLVGMTKEEAIDTLNKLKLNPVILDGLSIVAEKNTVLTQYPEPNSKVKQNRNIQVLINSGNPKIVPDIKELSLVKAKRELNLKNINIDRIDYYPYNGEKDIVLSTYPSIGKPLRQNQGISLLVSSSILSSGDIMPNIVGLTLEQAIFLLANTNFKIKDINYAVDNTKEPNTIIYTEPNAGEKVNDNYISIVINKIEKTDFDKEIDKIIQENLEELKKGKNEVSSNTEN